MPDTEKPQARRKKLNSMVSMRLTPYEMELIRSQAAARNSSVSATLRQAVFESVGRAELSQNGHTRTAGTFNAAATTTQFLEKGRSRLALPNTNQPVTQPLTTHS